MKKTPIVVTAIFRGRNGSAGYETGKEYKLFITGNTISPCVNQPGTEPVKYGSIYSFAENWKIIDPTEYNGSWQQVERVEFLGRGSIIRNKSNPDVTYVVEDNFGTRATAVASVDITNPIEWEFLHVEKK